MTLQEAITIQTNYNRALLGVASPFISDALKLTIEASKAWQEIRREWRRPASMLLPGEAKD